MFWIILCNLNLICFIISIFNGKFDIAIMNILACILELLNYFIND